MTGLSPALSCALSPALEPGLASRPPVRATVVGGAGYVGGELLRLLLGHPLIEIAAATSGRLAAGSMVPIRTCAA
jgi:hypothetical protein